VLAALAGPSSRQESAVHSERCNQHHRDFSTNFTQIVAVLHLPGTSITEHSDKGMLKLVLFVVGDAIGVFGFPMRDPMRFTSLQRLTPRFVESVVEKWSRRSDLNR